LRVNQELTAFQKYCGLPRPFSIRFSREAPVSSGERGKLAMLLFLIALLFGNILLIAGFESEPGVPAACVFAATCFTWWISYRISHSANGKGMILGLVCLGLWILNLAAALVVDFHRNIVGFFFWASTASLLVLIAAFAFSEARSHGPKTMPTPG
jgi:hypothetical protein